MTEEVIEGTYREIPPESPPESPGPSGGSSTGSSGAEHTCPYCGKSATQERFLNIHIAKKHPGRPKVSYQDAPEREAPPPPSAPQINLPPPIDLDALEATTARNIEGLGQLLHGGLQMAKLGKMVNPASRIPPLDTHLAIALQLRAKATAHLLVGYAEKNEVVMRTLQAFNRLFEGSEDGMVIASLALAGLATVGAPAPGFLQTMVNGDVMAEVARENVQLAAQADQIRAAQAAARAQAA